MQRSDGGHTPSTARAISTGVRPEPSFEDGLAVQRVLAAIVESAASSGSVIDLRED